MTAHQIAHSPRVLADLIPGHITRDIILVATGAGLVGIAAQFAIYTPLSPVPFTLQTLAVLGVAASLGTRRGVLALSLYAVAGVAGVPWFADHGSGWGGPSFGYIIGFVLAAAIAGRLAERKADRRVLGTVAIMLAGSALIYLIGTVWLAQSLSLSAADAFDLGVRPFLLTDLAKCVVAAVLLPSTWRLVGHADKRR